MAIYATPDRGVLSIGCRAVLCSNRENPEKVNIKALAKPRGSVIIRYTVTDYRIILPGRSDERGLCKRRGMHRMPPLCY